MPGRKRKAGKKRALKGINSIERQIEAHRQKLDDARKRGDIGLAGYYEKEIEGMKAALARLKGSIRK